MKEKGQYYVLKEKAVPDVLLRVVEAKRLLDSGKTDSVQDATEQVGISRSSFYKYKDDIFPFHETAKGKTITMVIQLDDEPGLLSIVLKTVAEFHANILTIHQSIPINGIASLTLSVDVLPETGDVTQMVASIEEQTGIHYVKILGREEEQNRIEDESGGSMIRVAVMGYGTIGSGVVEVLDINKNSIAKRAGEEIGVKYILDLRDFPGDPIQEKVVHDYKVIANDPEVQIVVETMGGVEPAYTFVKAMLEAGKHVTTSNKALVAAKGAELIALAKEKNVNFMFEASVGGGIPIIRPLNSCLTADEIEEITGIVNGTTNYMLTKMTEEGSEFDDVLKDAQAKGYAEKDPTADIEGYDACRKIAILTSLVCGQQVDFEDIHTEGITKITATDIRYAKTMGRAIKLLASSHKVGDGYVAMVAPFLLPATHPLYNVNDVFNAIFVHGNVLGDAMFYGSGAGKLPTASAVVADIVDMAKHLDTNIAVEWSSKKLELVDYRNVENCYFVRTSADEKRIEEVFGEVSYVTAEGVSGETGFVTARMSEADYEKKAAELGSVLQMIRVAQ